MIYILGSSLRSTDPSPSLPTSCDLAVRGYKPYFTDGRIKLPRDERVRPRASDVGTPGLRTHRLLPEHPWPLCGVFTNLSLQEEDISLDKVLGESTQPVWSSCLVLLSSLKSDFSSGQSVFVPYSFSHSLSPPCISTEPW